MEKDSVADRNALVFAGMAISELARVLRRQVIERRLAIQESISGERDVSQGCRYDHGVSCRRDRTA